MHAHSSYFLQLGKWCTPRSRQGRAPARPQGAHPGSGNVPGCMIDKSRYVREMFASIAPRYDATNRVLTAGIDERWRRRAVAELKTKPGEAILDLCCGTGDLAFALMRMEPKLHVTGVDFCTPMLERAREREREQHSGASFLEADALALPFADRSFDGAIMGFSMRNVVDIDALLAEVRRILRPGGRFVNLDVSKPPNRIVRRAFNAYFYNVVPYVGARIGGSAMAYRYLPQSLTNFPDADGLAARFSKAGFEEATYHRLMFGAIAVHTGRAA